ncbi:hypothetical protein NQ314_011334 [Rhamnusium bicolor]|uniref:SLC12A transporter C-terminal domain-containing protein n=1 Tax=Rhamnusium bicolor TaxID=1586634 RepID=A0AAV8XJR0_9CUCU|nr:hypothetical protein NQ314_011334 [Rhamnusium bicolor]
MTSSNSDRSLQHNLRDVISAAPNPDDSIKKGKSIGESVGDTGCEDQLELKEQISQSRLFFFQKKQKREGTIDVWWLYDDGGK